jgi:adenylate kinase
MRLILFGPPGAGKGTQAQYVAAHYTVPHISTGDLFRDNISRGTALGLEAKRYSEAGELVPDSVTNGMVRSRLEQDDCRAGFLLDGYPRTIAQADELAGMIAARGEALNAVVNLIVPDEELITRLLKRGRADDTRETIMRRLAVYRESTEPLIGYYRALDLLHDVEGFGTIDDITGRIYAALA